MKKEIPGFVRELPITILFLILVFGVVFWPLYSRWWNRKAKEKQAEETQEMTVSAEETTEGVSE
jgi:hypothetical protein